MKPRIPSPAWMLFLLSAACGDGAPQQGGSNWTAPSGAVPAVVADSGSGGSTPESSPSAGPGTPSTAIGAPAPTTTATGVGNGAPQAPGPDAGGVPAHGVSAPGLGNTTPEAGSPAPVSTPPPRVTTDAFTGAPPFASKTGSSPHNPGQACGKSGCHGGGGDGDTFLIGGTVYKDYKGTVPAPGVEIRVVDSKGTAMSVYSGSNGNFYISGGAKVTFPATVGARDGTTTRPMVTTLTSATMGTCASANCHIVGASPVDGGGYYPIHVP